MKRFHMLLILLLLTLLVAACSPTRGTEPTLDPNAPVSSDDPTLPATELPDDVILGDAMVDEIQIVFLESWPLQVMVNITGQLNDGCTEIGPIDIRHEGQLFKVHMQTVRPRDAVCTMVLRPFEQNIMLPVHGLPAGTYTVDVNGVTETFTFDVDNVGGAPEQGLALADEDQAELIRLTLERALIDREIPDYQLLTEGRTRIILSSENIDGSLVPVLPGVNLELLTPDEIQARADAEGDFLYLRFQSFEVESPTKVLVSLSNTWARAADSEMMYLSGGGFTIAFTARDGRWEGEITTVWIS